MGQSEIRGPCRIPTGVSLWFDTIQIPRVQSIVSSSESQEMKQSQTSRLPFLVSPTFRILLAMVLGGVFGVVVGPRAGGMGEIGKVVIGLIKTLAAPLIFFAVIDAFLRTTVRAKSGLLMSGDLGRQRDAGRADRALRLPTR